MLQDAIFASEAWLKQGRQRGRRGQVPEGVVQGLDLLPRQPRGVRRHRPQARRQAAQGPPDLAAQRGQRDHLAGPERDRHHRQGRLRPDGPGRARRQDPDQAGRRHRRGATTSPRRRWPRSGECRHQGRVLAEGRPSPSPRAASSGRPARHVPWHEGRPARAGLRRSGARRRRAPARPDGARCADDRHLRLRAVRGADLRLLRHAHRLGDRARDGASTAPRAGAAMRSTTDALLETLRRLRGRRRATALPHAIARSSRSAGAVSRWPPASSRGEEAIATFGGSVVDWPAFADSAAALARLKTRFRLGVHHELRRRPVRGLEPPARRRRSTGS